jgi:hypothetical protein
MRRKTRSSRYGSHARQTALRPQLEAFEARLLMATFPVLNTADSGAGSLRQAILDANAASGAATPGGSETAI